MNTFELLAAARNILGSDVSEKILLESAEYVAEIQDGESDDQLVEEVVREYREEIVRTPVGVPPGPIDGLIDRQYRKFFND